MEETQQHAMSHVITDTMHARVPLRILLILNEYSMRHCFISKEWRH
jgi:hypothetical protein